MKSKYINFISEVSKEFISNLNNNLLLKSKLKQMQITIDYTNTDLTSAKLGSTADCFYEMVLHINENENDSEEYIKFIIGHEIAHLLFRDINMLRISCYCSSDDSFAETYVRRQTPDGKGYGFWLEELLCDYLSLVILSKIYEKRYSIEELVNMVETETNNYSTYELTEKLICTFGKTIYDKLDAFKDAEVENILLYTAITGSINVFITQYEEIMGKNSWKLLNNYIDLYCITKENEYLLSISAELDRYKRITK